MLHKLHEIPEKYIVKMRENAIFEIARRRGTGDGFYIPGSNQSIMGEDEPGSYTIEEAKENFGERIPTTSLIQGILDEAYKMQQLREKLEYFVPAGAFLDDADMMVFLGLTGGDHLLQPDIIGAYRYLHTISPGGYTISSTGSLSKNTKFKVRLLLP